MEIDLCEHAIYAKDYTAECKINGPEIKDLIETKIHFFLKLTSDMSLIIPKHALDNQPEFKARGLAFGANYVDELNWEWK